MTTAFSSQATQLQVKISGVYVLVPAVKGFSVPKTQQVFDDTTNLDSAGGYPERIAVGKDFPTTSFDVVWNPSNYVHRFLEDAAFDGTALDFEAVLSNPNAATYQFSAFVTFEGKVAARKAGVATVTLDGTGPVVRSA